MLRLRRSRLFALHRKVLQESESLMLKLNSLMEKSRRVLKPKRQAEWWAPSADEAVKALAELQESVREEQAKVSPTS